MDMIKKMMESMMRDMSQEEKQKMMKRMMDKFFGDMTPEDKQKMMEEMMPRMMEGVDIMEMMPKIMQNMIGGGKGGCEEMMGMMSRMMEKGKQGEISYLMTEMMPQCLKMVLSRVPKEKRIDFALNMVTTLIEEGSTGMSEEEKKDFVAKVAETIRT